MRKHMELSEPNSCLNKAKDDELIFVLLERDITAARTVEFWVELRLRTGKNTIHDPQIQEALAWARCVRESCLSTGGADPSEFVP